MRQKRIDYELIAREAIAVDWARRTPTGAVQCRLRVQVPFIAITRQSLETSLGESRFVLVSLMMMVWRRAPGIRA